MTDIESLELKITSDSKGAKDGLDALIGTLDTLKLKTKGGVGLTSVANQVSKMAVAAGKLNGTEGAKLESLAKGLSALSGLGSLKLSSSVANQISSLGTAVGNLNGVDFTKVNDLATAVQPLTALGKSNLGSVLNQIKKLPEVMVELGKVDLTEFGKKVRQIATDLKPLADEMQKVANGFSAFPAKIQKFLDSSSKVPSSNASSARSFANLATKIASVVYAFKRGATTIASWINKSNEYVEAHNLFTVSMGKYAGEAQVYAEKVGEVMGIDPATWMESQGVFMTLATGFGVAGDRASVMSQQLTQLGYDLSSFFNISVEEAMQKLKSGFSGELEPLRNLGYDLSQAKLEAIALSLGIDKSVSSMTQAEKAQLRYYAIMTQVETSHGDMARTLDAPANQLRILKAQVEQAARALGNIFIPILNSVLPLLIAAAKVVRIFASAIASLAGFEMPEIDYSSLDNASSGAGALGEEFEKATESAKELNKTMLGIDELNVVSSSSGGSGSDAGASGAGFDFEIPTYDFIGKATNNRVNEIVDKMTEWLGLTGEIKSWSDLFNTNLGQILILIGEIGAGLLLWKLSKGLLDGLKVLQDLRKAGLSTPLTILAGATLSLTGFTIEFTGVVDAIKNGLDELNFGEIIAGGLLGTGGAVLLGKGLATWIGKAFAGSAVTKALGTVATRVFGKTLVAKMGAGAVGAAGAAIGAAVAGIIAGIPAFFVGVYDAIKNGIDWLSALLIPAGSTAAAAGIGAIIGMLGGPIVAGIGALIGLAVGLVTDLVILIVQNWESITAWCSNACAAIGQFFSDLWSDIVSVWNTVAPWFNTNVIKPVVSFFSGLWATVSGFFVSLWADIVAIYIAIPGWFYNNVIEPVRAFFINLGNGIETAAVTAWNGIKAVYATVTTWISTNIIQPVSTFFGNLWSGFLDGAKNAWAGVKNVFSTVASFFKTTFENAWNGVVKVFSIAGNIFTNIKDGIVSAFKVVVNGLISGINSVIAVPFRAINTALTKVRELNIMGLTPFSSIRTISIPNIPLLAQGGVVDAGQLFVAREAGAELVGNVGRKTSVMNNDQIVESVSQGVYQAVVAAMRSNNDNGSGAQSVNVYLDGKQVYASIEQHRKERGASLMGNQVYSY